jgi:hypothetical protein
MIFDLSTMHLGDVLMAAPAMRAGDQVIAKPQHRVPGLPVEWLDAGKATIYPAMRRARHSTDAWLESTQRAPVRHALLPEVERTLTVIAPSVAAVRKQWHGWAALGRLIRDAVWIGASEARAVWMDLLNRADTVICPDTGTAHMADALGVPRVIALHGVPANWPHCAPYWDRRYCIAKDSMDAITVDDVMEVVRG